MSEIHDFLGSKKHGQIYFSGSYACHPYSLSVGEGQPNSIAAVALGGYSTAIAFPICWCSHYSWYTLAHKVPSSQRSLACFNLTGREMPNCGHLNDHGFGRLMSENSVLSSWNCLCFRNIWSNCICCVPGEGLRFQKSHAVLTASCLVSDMNSQLLHRCPA